MGNIRIGTQTMLIGLLAMIGFILVGGIYFVSTQKQNAVRDTFMHETAGVSYVNAVKIGFLEERRNEKDFFLRHDMKYAERHAKTAEATLPYFDKLKTIHLEPDEQQLIDEMRDGFNAYIAEFAKVVDMNKRIGLSEKEGLRGELRKAVSEVEGELKKYNAKDLTITMLMMRRHEKDFFLRGDPKYIARQDKRMEEFDAALATADIPEDAKKDIEGKLDMYLAKFKAVAELMVEEVADKKTMSKLYASVEPKMDFLDKKGSEDAAGAAEELQLNTKETMRNMVVSMVVIALVVGILSLLIGRGISGPIAGMTGTMGRLAEGDLEVEIPAQGQSNEIGQMAAAVQVFKENAIRNKQMEAEAEAQKQQAEE
ncbi:MAG: HAMP domain-containing protein, partial [Rhodospirillales bacterium]|nr:HAMP domain-containing protein [Rhodospirillales bacterium]MCW8952799.1 HAMP domain-containing protein [Rhodospirillales bacterium]